MRAALRSSFTRLCLLGALLAPAPAVAETPDYFTVRARHVSSEAVLEDRLNRPLSEVRVDQTVRRFEWVPLESLSPALQQALIDSEDKRFYRHDGVDWRAMVGAAWENIWRGLEGRRPRGASTLTMQLAGLLDPALHILKGEPRSLGQKWDQLKAARDLERSWSKQQILEAYLNLAPFRGDLVGVGAAAWHLFGKEAGALDPREAAILVALLRAPNAVPSLVGRRACVIAAQLQPPPPCPAVHALALTNLASRHRVQPRHTLAPHLARRVLTRPGQRLQSTLDIDIQRIALAALRTQLAELAGRHVEDGAVLVLDNATGDVLAYVGSGRDLPAAADGVLVPRPAAALLQPFIYQLAVEKRWLTAASVLEDSPLPADPVLATLLPTAPTEVRGPVSVRTALAAALPVPALRALTMVGEEAMQERLRALGLEPAGGVAELPAQALGRLEVSLFSLANAYRALANGGEWSAARWLPDDKPAPRKAVMARDAAFITAELMAERGPRGWAALRCVTSREQRDSWCLGFTDRHTLAVWLGNTGAEPMRDATAAYPAAPVWRELQQALTVDVPSRVPRPPRGVTLYKVRFDPPVEPERDEWFLNGTQTRVVATGLPAVSPRLVGPGEGTVIALDPDIPLNRQKVIIRYLPAPARVQVRVGAETLAGEEGRAGWSPRPGSHRIELLGEDGSLFDAVSIEVRPGRDAASQQPKQERGQRGQEEGAGEGKGIVPTAQPQGHVPRQPGPAGEPGPEKTRHHHGQQ